LWYVFGEHLPVVDNDEETETLVEILVEVVAALNETVTERDLLKGMYNKEKAARLSVAAELEKAQAVITRLNFFLENT